MSESSWVTDSSWRVRALASLMAAVLVLAACGGGDDDETTEAADALTKSEIVIGVPAALSGTSAQSGELSKVVAEAWGEWVNDNGGINGHPVNVLVRDSGPDATAALAAVQGLAEDDNVLAMVGHGEPSDESFLPYLQEQQVPTVGGGPGNPLYFTHEDTWLFPLGFDAVTTNFSIPPYIAESVDAGSMMQFVCAEVAGCAEAARITEPVAEDLGIEYEATVTVDASAPSYTAECLTLKETGAEYAHVWVAAAGATRVIEECERQGVDVVYGGSPGGLIEGLLEEIPDTVELHTPASGFPWWVDAEPVQEFRDVMEEYSDGDYKGGYGTYTWAALELFRLAMAGVSDDPTRQEVRDAMFALEGEDLDGLLANEISFTQGEKPTSWPCYFELGLDAGELVNWNDGLESTCIDQ